MRFRFFKQGIMIAVCCISPIIYANDPVLKHDGTSLGIIGQTYPIQEEDFLQFILHRLQNMQQNGQWQRLQNQFSDNVKKHADRPTAVSLGKTLIPKSWDYNPSITVPYDLRDGEGRVFAKAGTTINPLQYISIHKAMIFFDGDDVEQVSWAQKLNKTLKSHTKLVLVNGSIIEQEKKFHQPIYFDQEGRLTTRFHIQHVPAVVMQERLHLKISEVLP
jgi:conjugal transfer pilus assembly protein TraW